MILRYCPECAAPLHKETLTNYQCENGHPFWNNPKTTVAVIFLDGDKALFAQRGIEPNKGKYDFPGGFLEYNECTYDAAVREIQEETGVTIDKANLQLVTAYTVEYLPNISVVDIIFVIRTWQGNFQPSDDVADLVWKPLSFMHDPSFAPARPNLQEKVRALGK